MYIIISRWRYYFFLKVAFCCYHRLEGSPKTRHFSFAQALLHKIAALFFGSHIVLGVKPSCG